MGLECTIYICGERNKKATTTTTTTNTIRRFELCMWRLCAVIRIVLFGLSFLSFCLPPEIDESYPCLCFMYHIPRNQEIKTNNQPLASPPPPPHTQTHITRSRVKKKRSTLQANTIFISFKCPHFEAKQDSQMHTTHFNIVWNAWCARCECTIHIKRIQSKNHIACGIMTRIYYSSIKLYTSNIKLVFVI